MKPFLQLAAEDLLRRVGTNLSRTVIVFPNKRASLFFNDYLVPSGGAPVWAPRYLTINELFLQLTDKRIADPIDTVCRLYRHYVRLTGSSEPLDYFYGWGERLLADFDDVDKNCADAARVFSDLKDYAELDHFDYLTPEQVEQLQRFVGDFAENKMTRIRQSFQRLWAQLLPLYEALRADLATTGEAYEGQLFREVAEGLQRGELDLPEQIDRVAFIGFNVIDRAEHTLFSALQAAGKALFYWDYDTFFASALEEKQTEAGLFMQQNLRDFPNALSESDGCFANFFARREERTLRYTAAPTETAGAQYVAQWLSQPAHFDAAQARRTAVVLCNESLLSPVLHALPAEVKEVNITKGFPLNHTTAYASLLRQMDRLTAELDAAAAAQKERAAAERFELPAGRALLPYIERMQKAISACATDEALAAEPDEGLRLLHTEACFLVFTTLGRFARLVEADKLPVQLPTLLRLMRQVMRTLSVPFHGEPAVGLQVMGVLETRCLDFENILMLSVGEGILPKKEGDASFIPYLIRKHHRLTTPDRKVAVYAYYFYRLLSRARHVELVYNASSEGLNRGEMSRFMRALLVDADGKVAVEHAQLSASPRPMGARPPEAARVVVEEEKNEKQPLFTKLSPSALKYYMKCPLQFYYRYVERLKTPQEQDPIINANDFGTVFHLAAERLLQEELQAGQRPVTPARILHFLENGGEAYCRKLVKECFEASQVESSAITERAAVAYIRQLLHYEAGRRSGSAQAVPPAAQFRLLDAEKTWDIVLPVPIGQRKFDFCLYGNIDRRDEAIDANGVASMRIIDYKTGRKHDEATYTLEDFFTPSKKYPENPLQAFIYSLMWSERTDQSVVPLLFYIPSLSSADFTPYIYIDKQPVTRFQTLAPDFKQGLIDLLAEIVDPDKPFEPTDIPENCRYCDFKSICRK